MSFASALFAKASRRRLAAAVQRAGLEPAQPAEMGVDDFKAKRAPDKCYRTTPLKGLFPRAKEGSYHDRRFVTLADVINHNDHHLSTGLNDAEKADLVEYLKSLRGRTTFATRTPAASMHWIRMRAKKHYGQKRQTAAKTSYSWA